MPVPRSPTALPTATGSQVSGSGRTSTEGFVNTGSGGGLFQTGYWGPRPTDDRNRPSYNTVVVQSLATATPDVIVSTTTQNSSLNTGEVVGITIAAAVAFFAILFGIIWWLKRRCNSRISGNGSRQKPGITDDEEEKPPTYEAAVFGIHSNGQSNISLNSVPQPGLQSPPPIHQILSPRPFNAASTNRTLHRFDLDPAPPRTLHQPENIIIYPHDSPPPSEQNEPSTRSAPHTNLNGGGERVLSVYHITDFTEDYPDTLSIDSSFMDEDEAAVREIV